MMRSEPRSAVRVIRRTTAVGLSILAGSLGLVPFLPPVPAAAAPSCGDAASTARAQPVADKPWAQQRFGYERLAGIADGSGQTIAVIDSGVDGSHPQLVGAVLGGVDALDPGGDGRLDCVGHGTAVASIIAARPVDGVTFRGVAPGARILPYRVSERTTIDGQSNGGRVAGGNGFADAVNDAVAKQATVINISMVMTSDNPALRAAIANAIANGVAVVAAVGNSHDAGDPVPYPAAYPGVIGVGAIGPDGVRIGMSQVGSYVDLVAPGGQITAAVPPYGHVTNYEGTSFAAPFVTGVVALVRQYRPNISTTELAKRLSATADPAPGSRGSTEYGAGVVNPYRAVTEQVGGSPSAHPPLPPPGDEAKAAVARRSAQIQHAALIVFAAVGLTATIIVLAAIVIPLGRRRNWRPGLPADGADPACSAVPAPVQPPPCQR